MGRKWALVAPGVAVAAVAGCSATGMHVSGSAHVQGTQVAASQQATPLVEQARLVTPSGQAAFHLWWVSGGYRQYQHVANDLSRLIITDALSDQDDTFNADAQRRVADATTAIRHLPPVDVAAYPAAVAELAQPRRRAPAGSLH